MRTALILFVAVGAAVTAGRSESSRYIFYQQNYRLPFLKGVSTEGRLEYDDIVRGRNLTLAQEQEKIAAWAKKYNRTDQVMKFKADKYANFKQLEQQIVKVFAALPAAFQENLKVLKSGDKTVAEIKKAIAEKHKKDKKLYMVLDDIVNEFNGWPLARPTAYYLWYRRKGLRKRILAARKGESL
ncbi:hypothetical protein COOONC_07417 [Cooperia oncophora]